MIREALSYERLRALPPAEAAAVFVARGAEGLNQSEQLLLDQWLAANAAHLEAYDGAGRAWRAFDDADGDEILDAMRAQAIRASPLRRPEWHRFAAAAAVLVVVLGAGFLILPALDRTSAPARGDPPAAQAAVQYVSGPSEVKVVTLPDASIMTLDAGSAATGRYGGDARTIELVRGRAYFEVRPDAARPFSVAAADHRIVALATRFEVDVAARPMTVTLLQGRVTVARTASAARPVTLEPGQQFVARVDDGIVRTLGENAELATAWREGLLDFDDMTLAEAVAQVNRYAREPIVIRDPGVAAMRISGRFRAGDAERFARTVAEVRPVRVVRRTNEIELVPAAR